MKKKIIVPILIFAFLLSACSKKQPAIVANNTINNKTSNSKSTKLSNKPFILGSIEYVGKIENIAKKSGNRNALSVIMTDVDKNESELDNNEPNNITRFHKLVSLLIIRVLWCLLWSVYNKKSILLDENNDPINMG